MASQPTINKTKKAFTTRDSVGIESVSTTISREICPVVNTVTPRPFYWAFIAWCYYDWYKNSGNNKIRKEVNEYIRKTNYFIALGNILANGYQEASYTGSQNIYNINSRKDEKYSYNSKYLTGIGAMGYYPAGLDTMGMVVTTGRNGEVYQEPKIEHSDGELLALAFEKEISKTEYYEKYRFKNIAIPNDVLIELGKKIKINLDGLNECKQILINNLFETKKRYKLTECKNYINYIKNIEKIDLDSNIKCREVFYDFYSSRAKKKKLPDELKTISLEWEVVVGRQYLTLGLELLWKYMLEELNGVYTKEEWLDLCINNSKCDFKLNNKLSTIIDNQKLISDEIEEIYADESSNRRNEKRSIENSIKVMLSVYNRFIDRDDAEDVLRYFSYGENRNAISFNQIFSIIEEHKDKTIKEFVLYLMENCLLKQHLNTAFNKMLDGRDGYYIEEIEERYVKKAEFALGFQGIRIVQLYSVMKDLGILNE